MTGIVPSTTAYRSATSQSVGAQMCSNNKAIISCRTMIAWVTQIRSLVSQANSLAGGLVALEIWTVMSCRGHDGVP